MNRRALERLPVFACAGLIGFLFLASVWNYAVGRDWPKLRIRSANPLAGVTAPAPTPFTLDALLSGEAQKAASTNLGRSLPVFPLAVRIKNQFLYSLFRVSGAASVVVGKNDQLYEPGYIEEFCARGAAPNAARLDAWAAQLREIQDRVEAAGKSFVYLVTPSKAARLPDYLPAKTRCRSIERGAPEKLVPFRAALEAHGVAYVDGAGLMSAKRHDYAIDFFPRGGTHWNLLGAALATRDVSEALARSGRGAPFGRFDFDWRVVDEATGTDRDLLDLLNLLWPNAHYSTAAATGRSLPSNCARAPKLLTVGGSFLFELLLDLGQSACPPESEYWHYFQQQSGRSRRTGLNVYADGGGLRKMEEIPDSADALARRLAAADAVILEENESVVSTMDQVRDLLAAARAAL